MNQETRQIIYNQLEILKRLDPDNANDFQLQQDIIANGYTSRYSNVLSVEKDELSEDIQNEVYETLNMFRALDAAMRKGWVPKDVRDAKFAGYDGNNDDGYFGFARHLLEVEHLFQESAPMKNSHSVGTIGQYRRMIAAWKKAATSYELTNEEAEAIIAA